jgi:hypothetical protein
MATDFDVARAAIAQASLAHQRRWVELVELVDRIERAAKAKRRVVSLVKRALDIEYDLTGDCAAVEPLANALGTPVEE